MSKINGINISDEALMLLFKINERSYVEYLDYDFLTIDDFKKHEKKIYLYSNHVMTVDDFKNRNCGGTFYLIDELLTNDMIYSVVLKLFPV